VGLLLAGGPVSGASAAEFGIVPGSFTVRMLDAEGNPENRSGSHPDRLQIDFALETEGTGTSARDIAIEMPPGLGGDPAAVPACPRQAHEDGEECPSDSQVGIVGFGPGESLPIFLLEPEAGQVAAFTSKTGLPIPFQLKLRQDDFGITFAASDLGEGVPNEAHIELWGVPAAHQEAPAAPPRPFLTAPSVCGPLSFTLRTRSREEGAPWLSEGTEAGPLSGCEGLRFAPRLALRLSNPVADSPTGLGMTLSMPAEDEGSELASAQMKDVSVALPAGLTVSPGGAARLTLCSDAQLGLGSETAATCPASARAGTVELTSASLPEPLVGAVYLGEQRGAERFRLFVVASGSGFVFKFITSLQPDPATGLLTATLHDLPQVAIGRIAMSLDGGPAGLLAAPLGCGPARGEARFAPYGGGPAVDSAAAVAISSVLPGLACPGPLPFSPQLLVSASSQKAGRASTFSATLHRRDGEGLPAQFALTLPAGLSAALGSVEACPESLAGSGNCPAASRVGSASAEVGSGPSPAVLSGASYIAGPYRRSPFSLVMAFRAAIGPFDLGTVAFRAAARIDGRTGRVTVATERLPSVVAGVPIRFQTIALTLDRTGLVHNPTSCGPHTLDAVLESQEGGTAALSSPYRVRGCKRLGFAPRLRATLASRGRPHKHSRVGLRVSARFRRADASLRSLAVSLPPALKLGIGGLDEICSRPDARRGLCPPGSKVGSSRARTPLLDDPLLGSIYVVQPGDSGEPDLWVELAGGGIKLTIRGTGATEHGRFVTRLAGLPDMPLSDFTMRLGSPGAGLLSLAANPCARAQAARFATDVLATAQNGSRQDSRLTIATGSGCRSGRSR
jgi:hypothetical protein